MITIEFVQHSSSHLDTKTKQNKTEKRKKNVSFLVTRPFSIYSLNALK